MPEVTPIEPEEPPAVVKLTAPPAKPLLFPVRPPAEVSIETAEIAPPPCVVSVTAPPTLSLTPAGHDAANGDPNSCNRNRATVCQDRIRRIHREVAGAIIISIRIDGQ